MQINEYIKSIITDSDEYGYFYSIPTVDLITFANENRIVNMDVMCEYEDNNGGISFKFNVVFDMNKKCLIQNGQEKDRALYVYKKGTMAFFLYIGIGQSSGVIGLDFYDFFYLDEFHSKEIIYDSLQYKPSPFFLGSVINKNAKKNYSSEHILKTPIIDQTTGVIMGIQSLGVGIDRDFREAVDLLNFDDFKTDQNIIGTVYDPKNKLASKYKYTTELKTPTDYYFKIKQLQKNIMKVKDSIYELDTPLNPNETIIGNYQKTYSELCTEMKSLKKKMVEFRTQQAINIISSVKNTKYFVSLCLLIRDENEYIEEWLEHHDSIGVDHFYIYDNESKIPVKDFVKNLKDGYYYNKCTFIDFPSGRKDLQYEAYADCLNRFTGESQWIGFIDTDEFVDIFHDSLKGFLRRNANSFSIYIPWEVHNANGKVYKDEKFLTKNYPNTAINDKISMHGKVFLQPHVTKKMYVHLACPDNRCYLCMLPNGKSYMEGATDLSRLYFAGDPEAFKFARVRHYMTRSFEEWCEKIQQRGTCDRNYRRKFMEFFDYNPDMKYLLEDENVKKMINMEQDYH